MPEVMTQEKSRLLNGLLSEKLRSDDPVHHKQAADVINEYIRTQVKEDSYLDKIIEPYPIQADELDRVIHTDKPTKVVDVEPESQAGYTVGYGGSPDRLWLRGRRFPVTAARLQTRKYAKDVAELRTWHMDLRQVVSDNAIRDLLAEKDGNFIAACNKIVGPADTVMPHSGTIQHKAMSGDITRDAIMEAFKVLQSTPGSHKAEKVLLNHNTILDLSKIAQDEWGNDHPGDIMANGWTKDKLNGADLIVTIKRNQVPDKNFYWFPNQIFIGKNFEFTPTTMHVKKEYFLVEFFAYLEFGCGIANTNGVARTDHR